ncbi:MAG: 5-formyltetrahydrofolate cyclo-ligase [Erysipelotrichaceae bacterium]|nr:5-formyltetrahydrofolate cyclo-ligase [Erysipelotrichaceae bacterium]MDO5121885.1 5-formyltetrahydrofolate cyclo-ligase [Erysipelotrichaceae bacterium]
MKKAEARTKGLNSRRDLTEAERNRFDASIASKVMDAVSSAKVIGCYVSFGQEADTWKLIGKMLEAGKQIAVPKTFPDHMEFHLIGSLEELRPGFRGILEPVSDRIIHPSEIDIMLVPLSSFDECCHRTGYGKGYYDRILPECRMSIGLAYECQKCGLIETDPWDQTLDRIITESRVYLKQQPE